MFLHNLAKLIFQKIKELNCIKDSLAIKYQNEIMLKDEKVKYQSDLTFSCSFQLLLHLCFLYALYFVSDTFVEFSSGLW